MIRVGFIGTGNFAQQHAEILKELGVSIVACYGTNLEKTISFAKTFRCEIYTDPLKLISANIIDALYIVIPPSAHTGNFELKAIKEKIPFLCEKPVGLDLSLCKEISKGIEQENLITSSGYLLRYESLFEKTKEILKRNKTSTIRICSYTYMPEVHWWRKLKSSGGMMVESGSHYIDLLRYLFGEVSSIASVTSEGISQNSIPNSDIYDSMEAILKFQSGEIASIGITHLLNKIDARKDELLVYGQDLALKIDLYKLRYENEATIFYKEVGTLDWKSASNYSSKKELMTRESNAFINAIKQNNPSLIKSTYPDAVKSLHIALAMNQSAELKQFTIIE